jgi:hypothetical protein
MRRTETVLRFVWDFVVGDDWVTATGVALAITLTALVATTSIPAWWVMPVVVAGLLGLSLWRAAKPNR